MTYVGSAIFQSVCHRFYGRELLQCLISKDPDVVDYAISTHHTISNKVVFLDNIELSMAIKPNLDIGIEFYYAVLSYREQITENKFTCVQLSQPGSGVIFYLVNRGILRKKCRNITMRNGHTVRLCFTFRSSQGKIIDLGEIGQITLSYDVMVCIQRFPVYSLFDGLFSRVHTMIIPPRNRPCETFRIYFSFFGEEYSNFQYWFVINDKDRRSTIYQDVLPDQTQGTNIYNYMTRGQDSYIRFTDEECTLMEAREVRSMKMYLHFKILSRTALIDLDEENIIDVLLDHPGNTSSLYTLRADEDYRTLQE
jgi:hypothetical protein